MAQENLFDKFPSGLTTEAQARSLVRTDHPATSHAAAARAVAVGLPSRHGRMVVTLLQKLESLGGLTCHELAERSDALTENQIHKRTREVERLGYIEDCGDRVCQCAAGCHRNLMTTWKISVDGKSLRYE